FFSFQKFRRRLISLTMKKYSLFISALLTLAMPTQGSCDSLFFGQEAQILVNNRILAKVNGKAISVIDLMKKLDMLFYRQFPEYTSSMQARFQFYQANWKHVFQELLDKE